MKNKIFLTIKSALITIFVLAGFGLMFKIANEGRKKTQEKEVMVFLNKNRLYLKNGDLEYLVEPDKEKLIEIFNKVYSNPFVLPCPFNFCVISKSLVDEIF